jgi:hypothetical protein
MRSSESADPVGLVTVVPSWISVTPDSQTSSDLVSEIEWPGLMSLMLPWTGLDFTQPFQYGALISFCAIRGHNYTW